MDDTTSFVRTETLDLVKRRKLLWFSNNKEELEESIIDPLTKGVSGT